MEPILKLEKVTKVFIEKGSKPLLVLQDISLEILPGEFFVLVGPSGSGKSTILRIMSGFEKGYTGRATWGSGIGIADFSFVFQQFALLPWLTVYQNTELGLLSRENSEAKRKKIVLEELHKLGLEKFVNAYPKELSGGMRQRVGIARALATEPKVIFMDEPFSELDSFTAEELRQEVLKIWKERRPTIVMVTHLIDEALELADRVAVLTARPGKVERILHNKLTRPRNKRTQDFYKVYDELFRLIKP